VTIRAAGPEDMAGIQRICERELDLEPDGGELPAVLARGVGQLGLVAEDGDARVERVYWLYRKAL
jgi:hypothetical protein